MDNSRKDLVRDDGPARPGRRQALRAGIALAATSLLPFNIVRAQTREEQPPDGATSTRGERRRLGSLEVSSVGIGVQNMSRTYQTTIPTRSEMFNIIRTARLPDFVQAFSNVEAPPKN